MINLLSKDKKGCFFTTIIINLVLLLFISYNCFAEQKADTDAHNSGMPKFMIVSGHPNYPPFMWQKGEEITGAGVELATLICKELNIPFKIKWTGPWQRVQNLAKSGALDLIVGIYSNDERRTYLDYTIPYMSDPTSVTVLNEKVFDYKNWKDLIGKSGITMHGDSFGQDLDIFIDKKLNVNRAYTVDAIVKNLIAGRVDYILWGYYPTVINAAEQGVYDKIKVLEPPVVTENMYMAFSKKSPFKKYLPEVNSILKRYKEDGTVEMLIERNLSIYNTAGNQ